MITLQEFLETIEYKITEGSDYRWDCFGTDVRYIEYTKESSPGKFDFTVGAVFDTRNQQVYEIEVWDYSRDIEYRWIDSEYIEEYKGESSRRGLDYTISVDDKRFIDLEVESDVLEKARAVATGEEYDRRVVVPLDLSEEDEILLMRLAHEADMSLNQFVEHILQKEIDRLQEV